VPSTRIWPAWAAASLALLAGGAFALRLAYGSAGLASSRFWDERYVRHNVAAELAEGRPAHAFYGRLAHLPQTWLLRAADALHRATDGRAPAIHRPGEGLTPWAIWLCRLVEMIYGTLAVLLVARIGRRLAEPLGAGAATSVGLLAALLTAVSRDQIFYSGYFKPDILVALLTLVAFDLALSARRRPRLGTYLAGGAAVGLAVAAKYTGVAAALPLIAAGLAARRGAAAWWRRAAWLAAAGAVAVAVFLAWNPYLRLTLEYIDRLVGFYGRRGATAGGSHLGVLLSIVRNWLAPPGPEGVLGPVVGSMGLLGAAWSGWRLRRRPGADESADPREGDWGLALAMLAGFPLLYSSLTIYYRPNNLLAVTPFLLLFAARAAVAAALWLGDRLPAGGRRAAALAGWSTAVAALAIPAAAFSLEPWRESTYEVAARRASARLGSLRNQELVYEGADAGHAFEDLARRRGAFVLGVATLGELAGERLDRADLEVVPRRSLAQGVGLHAERLARASAVEEVSSAGFLLQGPDLVLLFHPWTGVLAWRGALAGDELDSGRFELPATAGDGLRSVRVSTTRRRRAAQRLAVEVGGRRMPLLAAGREGDRFHYASARLPAAPVWLILPANARRDALEETFEVEVWAWHRPGPGPASGGR
jgi:4-amino-4-deoxy-L-arabinose transferase-like glycosyltransferase